jgi:hypothetical protein
MRVLIVTSCTGQKSVDHERRLTLDDFAQGPVHVARREQELSDLLTPAQDLYTGQQHVRLMRGLREAAARPEAGSDELAVDLWIVSAGYGLVPGDRRLAPYEATFQGMRRADIRKLAGRLEFPRRARELVSKPYDLILILLGDDYLDACQIDADTPFGGATLVFCGCHAAKLIEGSERARAVVLTTSEAKRFSCGLVGLKGELAGTLLVQLAEAPMSLEHLLAPGADVLSLLRPRPSVPDVRVDWVVRPSRAWWGRSRSRSVKYFVPDWNDLVDPDYDFEYDRPSSTPAHWTNQVYAHQLYGEPQYDGILVSRAVLDESNAETVERLHRLGIHRYLRVPHAFPVMGDCGAFAYVRQSRPPYSTEDVVTYYTQLGFDLGVSVDHLIPPYQPKEVSPEEYSAMKRERYNLTIENAEAFLRAHRGAAVAWTPVGAVQGWDAASYAAAATRYVSLGYTYIALGALVPRSRHPHLILPILRAVHEAVRGRARIHLLGVASAALLPHMTRMGVSSVDSASMLRKAWEGHSRNYLTERGWYPAIRIPPVSRNAPRYLKRLERESLSSLREFARGRSGRVLDTARLLAEYDHATRPERRRGESVDDISLRVARLLEDRPWDKCQCAVCRSGGIEIVIFRGNNRNRRRGFHNTQVFYAQLEHLLRPTRVGAVERAAPEPRQLRLLDAEA